MPQNRVKRRWIGTGEYGIKRRRASMMNEVWGMDFVQYRTAGGRPFRMRVVLDEYTRERLTTMWRGTSAARTSWRCWTS